MPVVKIDLTEGRTKEQKAKIMESIFKAFEENDIPREWVIVIISDSPEENWGVQGELLSEKIKRERKE